MQILSLLTLSTVIILQINADEFSLIQPISVEKAPTKTISSGKSENKKVTSTVEDLKIKKNIEKKPAKNLTKTKTLDINFDAKESVIPDSGMQKIEDFKNYMNKNKGYQVIIYSHTDSIGEESDNLLLSQQRAKVIKEALINMGISSTRLTGIGKGDKEPIAGNNNRIEVLIIK